MECEVRIETARLQRNTAGEVVHMLAELGVRHAFGVSGGGIGPVWRALLDTPHISTLHFRNEAGAAFAAIEASVESNCPVVVFCTTGPGITNAITGIAAARAEGAKVVLVSGRTSPAQRGRGAVQETPMPSADLFTPGWLFDEVFSLDSPDELAPVGRRLCHGVAKTGAYLAHLSIPLCLQGRRPASAPPEIPPYRLSKTSPDPQAVDEVAALLEHKRGAIWLGHGARRAAGQVRALARLTGVPVLSTARGKGVFPEEDPQFAMVTGLGGHPGSLPNLQRYSPEFMLVLGTGLGEPSSGWDQNLVPPDGFVHVDIDPAVAGRAFGAPTLAIEADASRFLDQLLLQAHRFPHRGFSCPRPFPEPVALRKDSARVRPQALFQQVQNAAVEPGIPVLVEPGSAMAWAAHLLRMSRPGQLRIVGGFGSMGHMTCGALGSSVARGGPALCVTGDGSMLMNNEVNTAVTYNLPVVWVVLNNARYQMCEAGMGFTSAERHAQFEACDFVQVAHGMGASARTVSREADLEEALACALEAARPYVVDVALDESVAPPFDSRFKTLR